MMFKPAYFPVEPLAILRNYTSRPCTEYCRVTLAPMVAQLSSRYHTQHGPEANRKDSKPLALPKFAMDTSFRITQPPNPLWKLGQGLPSGEQDALASQWKHDEEYGWKSWQAVDLPNRDLYRLLTSAIVPRPIAFVSTLSQDNVRNLAPMSYFSMVSSDPPLLTVSLTLSKRRPKDTRENIVSTKEFTVNIISEPFVEATNACSIEAPAHIDEWVVSGLTPEASDCVKPPRVKESAVGLECELYDMMDIRSPRTEEITTSLVFGLIKRIHVRNSVLAEDGATVDAAKLRPVARLGGSTYVRLGEAFDLGRPSWKALRDEIENMHHRVDSLDEHPRH